TSLDASSFFASSKEKFNLNQFGGAVGGAIKKDKTFCFIDYEAKRQRKGTPSQGLIPTEAMKNGDYSEDALGNPRVGFLTNPYATGTDKAFQCDGAGNPSPVLADGSQARGADCNIIPQALFIPAGKAMIDFYP